MTTETQDTSTDDDTGGCDVIHLERISRSTAEPNAITSEVRDTLAEAKEAGTVADATDDPATDPPKEFDGWVARDTSIDVYGYGKTRDEALRDLSAQLSDYAHTQQTDSQATNPHTEYDDELPR